MTGSQVCAPFTLVFGRRHLERIFRTYVEHYNRGRPDRGLDLQTPDQGEGPDRATRGLIGVHRRDLMGDSSISTRKRRDRAEFRYPSAILGRLENNPGQRD